MAIKIKALDAKWANADEVTKRQLLDLAIGKAFESAVSEEQLLGFVRLSDYKLLEKKVLELLALEKRVAKLENIPAPQLQLKQVDKAVNKAVEKVAQKPWFKKLLGKKK